MAEMLSAAQVERILLRAAQGDTKDFAGDGLREFDVPALVAQDARWRALVGELLSALVGAEWPDLLACPACAARPDWGHEADCAVAALIVQAQAALGGDVS